MKIDKKNLNIAKVIAFSIIIALLLGYSMWALISLIQNPTDTFMVEEGTLSLEERVEGYIIREETVVLEENTGTDIVKIKDEGQKIAKGEAIFRYKSGKEDELVKKIAELDEKIEIAMANETNLLKADVPILEEQINEKLKGINQQNDIQKIIKLKNEINSSINKKAKIAGELSPSGSYIKSLITERSEYENELNSNSQYITSPVSGVVSYVVDGYEKILSIDNIEGISKKNLEDIDLKAGQVIIGNDRAAKVVNNYEAYLAIILNNANFNQVKEGNKVTLRFATTDEITATIEKIKPVDKNEKMIFFKIKNGIESTLNYRKVNVDIIWWKTTGLKVPNSAIITEDDRTYVIRNRAGYTDKIFVKVLKRNDTYSIIDNFETQELRDMGLSSSEISSNRKISMYDEIILQSGAN